MSTTCESIIRKLKAMADPANVAGMARFGINPEETLGVSMPDVRCLAKEIGRNHELAQELFDSGIHEAKILAGLVAEAKRVTESLMEKWVAKFDSWDVCDQVCMNLFDRTPFAYDKAAVWAGRPEEFVKRAGFAMMASLAVHDKKADDSRFLPFLALIEREANDERNFVKKAVNWALRQVGKRNAALNSKAIESAERIAALPDRSARWIAADALRELNSEAVRERNARKAK